MPKLREASYKMVTFARQIIAGEEPLAALEKSEFNTADWGSDASKKAFAYRLLKHPLLAPAFAKAQAEQYDEAILSRGEALERLTLVARASLSELIEFRTIKLRDDKGLIHHQAIWAFKDSDTMHPDQLAAIAELTATDNGFKIKLRDADKAIAQIAKMQAWDKAPKAPVDGAGMPAPILTMTVEEYKQARREMLAEDDC